MRFAHLADCHLGAWGSHPELRELPMQAFAAAVDRVLDAKADFVLLAGDFFDSSMPTVDVLRFSVEQLMRLKRADVSVYSIAGSHDYSPTGKTMLSVLEAAGLLHNVHMKWVEDKSGARIFGIEGLRGGLDREYFDKLETNIETNSSPSASYDTGNMNSPRHTGARYNIFMFHAAVDELSGIKGVPLAALPKGFDYYAAGHVHTPAQRTIANNSPAGSLSYVVFPGPLFPVEFSELEELGCGSFCIVDVKNDNTNISTVQLQLAPVRTIEIKCDGKTPLEIETEFIRTIDDRDVVDKIVLLKAKGAIDGRPTDVNWRAISEHAQSAGARAVKRSVHLAVTEAVAVKVDVGGSLEHIEKAVIQKSGSDIERVRRLMDVLAVEKAEGEKNVAYEEKIKSGMEKVLKLGD